MLAYVTYTKTLAHVHGHLKQFYRNCGTLNFPQKIEKFKLKVLGFVILGTRFCFAMLLQEFLVFGVKKNAFLVIKIY